MDRDNPPRALSGRTSEKTTIAVIQMKYCLPGDSHPAGDFERLRLVAADPLRPNIRSIASAV